NPPAVRRPGTPPSPTSSRPADEDWCDRARATARAGPGPPRRPGSAGQERRRGPRAGAGGSMRASPPDQSACTLLATLRAWRVDRNGQAGSPRMDELDCAAVREDPAVLAT